MFKKTIPFISTHTPVIMENQEGRTLIRDFFSNLDINNIIIIESVEGIKSIKIDYNKALDLKDKDN